jgi:hypothetical protein
MQGVMISLSYCYLNSEVQGVVRSHWRRWMMVRRVGREVDRMYNSNSEQYANTQSSRLNSPKVSFEITVTFYL